MKGVFDTVLEVCDEIELAQLKMENQSSWCHILNKLYDNYIQISSLFLNTSLQDFVILPTYILVVLLVGYKFNKRLHG